MSRILTDMSCTLCSGEVSETPKAGRRFLRCSTSDCRHNEGEWLSDIEVPSWVVYEIKTNLEIPDWMKV